MFDSMIDTRIMLRQLDAFIRSVMVPPLLTQTALLSKEDVRQLIFPPPDYELLGTTPDRRDGPLVRHPPSICHAPTDLYTRAAARCGAVAAVAARPGAVAD